MKSANLRAPYDYRSLSFLAARQADPARLVYPFLRYAAPRQIFDPSREKDAKEETMTSLQSTDCQLSLADWLAQQDRRARGETFSEALDKSRLGRQAMALANAMSPGEWMTLQEIKDAGVPGMLTSISARVREVRCWLHETAGGTIERRRHPVSLYSGLWQYRLVHKNFVENLTAV